MDLSRRVEIIDQQSDALADAAGQDLTASIVSCPGWTMVDLVQHVLQVQRSWKHIVETHATAPDWSEDPMPDDDELVDEFRGERARVRVRARRDGPRVALLDLGTRAERGVRAAVPGPGDRAPPLGRRARGRAAGADPGRRAPATRSTSSPTSSR